MNPKFCFITSSHNTGQFIRKNLDSIRGQDYPHYRVQYIDDASTDDSADILRNYKAEHPDMPLNIEHHSKRGWPAYSRYRAYMSCADSEICVLLDGDDWFTRDDALTQVAKIYREHPDTLATFGSMEGEKWQYDVWDIRYERNVKWTYFPHLRTVNARILKAVPMDYLRDREGRWFTVYTDCALLLCAVELAGHGRYRFMPEKIVHYNRFNCANNPHEGFDQTKKHPDRLRIEHYVRYELPPLAPLDPAAGANNYESD